MSNFLIMTDLNKSVREDVVIHLKNGKKKFGVMIDRIQENSCHFVPWDTLPYFNEGNSEYLEIIPAVLIESIETDLR